MQRRNFIKNTLAASTALAIPGTAIASVDNWAKLDEPKKSGGSTILAQIHDKDYWLDNAIEIMKMLIKDTEKTPPNGSFQIEYIFEKNSIIDNYTVFYDINDMIWKRTVDGEVFLHGNMNYIDGLKNEIDYCKCLRCSFKDDIVCINLSFPTFSRFLWDDYYQMNKTFSSGYYARQENPNELDELFNKYNIFYQQYEYDYSYDIQLFDFKDSLKKLCCPVSYFYDQKRLMIVIQNASNKNRYLAFRKHDFHSDKQLKMIENHLERIHNYKKHLLSAYKNNMVTPDTALYYAFNHKLSWQHHDMQKGYIS